jgi:hypothetical protein
MIGPEPGSIRLAAQHRELVAQNEDPQILGGVATGRWTSSGMERHSVR